MQIVARITDIIESHLVADVPPHLEDLFDHDEATHTGRLGALALMLLSANIVVYGLKMLLS